MNIIRSVFLLGVISLVQALGAQEPVPYENGPIHEAYMVKAAPDSILLQAVGNEPPPRITEHIPPRCDDLAVWIAGYWAWDENIQDFVWASGVWRRPPPDHVWIPGEWKKFGQGWVWLKGFWSKIPLEAVAYIDKRPPDPKEEKKPAAPGEDYFWVPGYWEYQSNSKDYRWLSGQWFKLDPNWVYVPAYYLWRKEGYVFIPGYWDWKPEERGCVYSAVQIDPAYRQSVIYMPSVVLGPDVIIRYYFLWYPDYICFFWWHWHFHPDFWGGWCCVPPWWGWWDPCWCFGWMHTWELWWWWGNPGFPAPWWLLAAMAGHIPPPFPLLLNWLEGMAPPPFIMPWGVVPLGSLLDAMEKVTGNQMPIVPASPEQMGQIEDLLQPQEGAVREPLLPTGDESDLKNPPPAPEFPNEEEAGTENIAMPPVYPRPPESLATPPKVPNLPAPPTKPLPQDEPAAPPSVNVDQKETIQISPDNYYPPRRPPRFPPPRDIAPPTYNPPSDTSPQVTPPTQTWPPSIFKPPQTDRKPPTQTYPPQQTYPQSEINTTPQTQSTPRLQNFQRLRQIEQPQIQQNRIQRYQPQIQQQQQDQQQSELY